MAEDAQADRQRVHGEQPRGLGRGPDLLRTAVPLSGADRARLAHRPRSPTRARPPGRSRRSSRRSAPSPLPRPLRGRSGRSRRTEQPRGSSSCSGCVGRAVVGVRVRRRVHPRLERDLRDTRRAVVLEAAAAPAADHVGGGRRAPLVAARARPHRPDRRTQSPSALGIGETAKTIWDTVKWPVVVGLLVVLIGILYYASPNVKLRGLRWVTPGSIVAVAVWLVASGAFAFYVARFGSCDKSYGTLGGVIVLLIWLLNRQPRDPLRAPAERRARAKPRDRGGPPARRGADPAAAARRARRRDADLTRRGRRWENPGRCPPARQASGLRHRKGRGRQVDRRARARQRRRRRAASGRSSARSARRSARRASSTAAETASTRTSSQDTCGRSRSTSRSRPASICCCRCRSGRWATC